MSKTIDFIAINKYFYDICEKPSPASNFIPNWWRDASPYVRSPENPDGKKIIIENGVSNASFKKCTPMLDLLTAGYIFTLWSDVQVRKINNRAYISWRVKEDVFELHDHQEVDIPEGYSIVDTFKYKNPWIPKLPKGYSALIIPCVGYPNPIFKTMQAIIDYDKTMHPLYPPMFIKDNFEGIIEKGTPMFQMIPFKRDNWKSEFSFLENSEMQTIFDSQIKSTLVNNYVKNFWQKKTFK